MKQAVFFLFQKLTLLSADDGCFLTTTGLKLCTHDSIHLQPIYHYEVSGKRLYFYPAKDLYRLKYIDYIEPLVTAITLLQYALFVRSCEIIYTILSLYSSSKVEKISC